MPPSRRTPRQKLKSTESGKASQKLRTDAILPIKPEFVKLIVEQKKNHEYRTYKMVDAKRLWLYETAPTQMITHVATTSHPKVPGEVRDPQGIGNDDFDAGRKVSKYGYPILHLHRLQKPLSANHMRNYGVSPPQGLVYVPTKLAEAFPIDKMEKLF